MSPQPQYLPAIGDHHGIVYNDILRIIGRLCWRLAKDQLNGRPVLPSDDLGLLPTFQKALFQLSTDPWYWQRRQTQLWFDSLTLWQAAVSRLWSYEAKPAIVAEQNDRRFHDDAWSDSCLFDLLKQSYLLSARWLHETLTGIDGLDKHTARKLDFYTRQFADALAPTNFAATNPEVLREFQRSGGLSLLKGLRNFLADLERGNGQQLNVRMSDMNAFRLGENIAVTPGTVIFRNRMMELLQYTPSTAKVLQRPLLIVPPWINKYYILDLRTKNSFIKWAVAQGHTVFVISWVNPNGEYADTDFDAYLNEGILSALDAIGQASGANRVNAVGYCLGGTLLATGLAYLAATEDTRIASATFFTTMLDFSEPGELGVFLDQEQVSQLEQRMAQRGYLDGIEMATTFSMLRANDLFWSFFISNYLLGKEPLPFDLLYWNSDSTRMPSRMHSFYLRNMYLDNKLCQPGGIRLNGRSIDLGKIRAPAYFLSTIEDHIAPWASTYAGARLLGGPVRFVLGASGHIAGVINPPTENGGKYGYWTYDSLPPVAQDWLNNSQRCNGSWWPDWQRWLLTLDDRQVPARIPGSGGLAALDPAPGRYVRHRLS